ncbi:hypothetical protein GUJ93_ZPchr0011g27530 [Zizania palustris]|uniref:Uncharacterized protein n=1 Tax=Zizania palustris TaxID=103762 RepID=A0A8J5WIS0_ZIZPA|nr:hypothetical protein GUJ93_ZPchr0011g27530 [Zizania palustris]
MDASTPHHVRPPAPAPPHAAGVVSGLPLPSYTGDGGLSATSPVVVHEALCAPSVGDPATAGGQIRWEQAVREHLGQRPPILNGQKLPAQLLWPSGEVAEEIGFS